MNDLVILYNGVHVRMFGTCRIVIPPYSLVVFHQGGFRWWGMPMVVPVFQHVVVYN